MKKCKKQEKKKNKKTILKCNLPVGRAACKPTVGRED